MKYFLKELDNKCCLTVSQNHMSTTSLYKKGKEKDPIATLTLNGDGKISLLRLAVYVVGIITAVSAIVYAVSAVKKWIHNVEVKLCARRAEK